MGGITGHLAIHFIHTYTDIMMHSRGVDKYNGGEGGKAG